MSQAKYYTYEDYSNENYTYNKFMVIYDINLCVAAFDGVHTEPQDDGDCTTAIVCTMCAEHTFKDAMEHVSGENMIYADFMQAGQYYVGCINDGCMCGTYEKAEALFTCLGYSAQEFGGYGITVGYKVNNSAIEKYIQAMGCTVRYGVFAVSAEKLGDGDVMESENTIIAEILNNAYDIFELKIVGITDENKDVKLALGAYVSFTGKDGTSYSCMQADTPSAGDKYSFVSYSDIIGK